MVTLAAGGSSEGASALEELCRQYRVPVYTFIRNKGYNREEAEDLAQEFFSQLIKDRYLLRVHPEKGRFRTFLLSCASRFLHKEWQKRNTIKRGGGYQFLPLHDVTPGDELQHHQLSPELLYDRTWALTLLEAILAKLKEEFYKAGKKRLFSRIEPVLTETRPLGGYKDIAQELGMSEAAVKKTVQRARERYCELLRAEVRRTVASETFVDEELRSLILALARET